MTTYLLLCELHYFTNSDWIARQKCARHGILHNVNDRSMITVPSIATSVCVSHEIRSFSNSAILALSCSISSSLFLRSSFNLAELSTFGIPPKPLDGELKAMPFQTVNLRVQFHQYLLLFKRFVWRWLY